MQKDIELRAEVTTWLEHYIDYIQYTDVSMNRTETIVSTDSDSEVILRFYANNDGTDKLINWNFVSDGSVQLWGFTIQFEERSME